MRKPHIKITRDGPDDQLTATVTVTGDPHQVVDVLAHGLPREVLEALMLAIGEELLKTKELPAE